MRSYWYRVSTWENEKVLVMEDGDGCTTRRRYLMTPNSISWDVYFTTIRERERERERERAWGLKSSKISNTMSYEPQMAS